MKYAQSGSNGVINAFYDDSINSSAQIGTAIQITDAQWADCINNPGKWMIVSGALVLTPPPTTTQLLAQAQATQLGVIGPAYQNAIAQPVSYTSKSGVTETYQADTASIGNVSAVLNTYVGAAATPAGFYWVATDNTQVPFAYADLQGLAAVLGAQGWVAFQKLQGLKNAILTATTVKAVQAVVW